VEKFSAQVNDDLNMPRALAVTWELVKSDLDAAVKKGTLLFFDQILGLGLADWRPSADEIPAEITDLLARRQAARAAKQWAEADSLRDQITAAGYLIEDTPEGPRARRKK
jgi:cysteinyl-tRNA synthetase